MKQTNGQAQMFDTAAYYEIVFHGGLVGDWAVLMEDMEIEVLTSSNGRRITVLSGWLRDQAALAGVLNRAYNMGVPLLSVQRLVTDASDRRMVFPILS